MSTTLRKRLDRLVAVLGAAVIVATGVVFVAHNADNGDVAAQQAAAPSAVVDEVPIRDFLYEPATITVAVGTKVTFTNEDKAPHTATSGQSPSADGVFDTGTLQQGQSRSVRLTKAGTFAYYCAIHPFMKATVIVT
jgi:plastocyanin